MIHSGSPHARPSKRPKTGVYRLRKRVPKRLIKLVGKSEELCSLDTKDPAEARARHAIKLAEVEARWANLERGEQPLTHRQVHAIAGEIYRAQVSANESEPGSRERWAKALVTDRFIATVRGREGPTALKLATGWSPIEMMARRKYGPLVDTYVAREGLIVSVKDYRRLVLATADAMRQAHEQILRNAKGDYSPDQKAARFPPAAAARDDLTFEALWADYETKKKPSAKTVKRWYPVLQKMMAFARSDNVHSVTEQHILDWREHLLATIPDPATVKNVYIAAAKAFFGWALRQKKVAHNPAAEVHVDAPKKPKLREKGFTAKEADLILSSTLASFSRLLSREHAAARRWVPWLCAYTGARVNEMTQLRGEDVFEEDGIWVVRITPEAGSTKTNDYRLVPLHPHLIEQGFVTFAQANGRGPLFYSKARQRGGSGQNPTHVRMGQKLAEWVRGLGVDDPNVGPNHGWRHRFKTVARQCGMDPFKVDAIQGHAPETEGGKYGRFPPDALKPEIHKHPRYEVVARKTVDRRRGNRPPTGKRRAMLSGKVTAAE